MVILAAVIWAVTILSSYGRKIREALSMRRGVA